MADRPAALVAIDAEPVPTGFAATRTTAMIRAIAKRYADIIITDPSRAEHARTEEQAIAMLRTVHRRNRLRLDRLEAFDDFNLGHDVGGLFRHADQRGVIGGFFSPRCGLLPKRVRKPKPKKTATRGAR